MDKDFQQLHDSLEVMRRDVRLMAEELRGWSSEQFAWSEWEPHTVGIIPRRINGRWYFKGDRVYRKERMRGLTGSQQYRYGDEFDVLKDA